MQKRIKGVCLILFCICFCGVYESSAQFTNPSKQEKRRYKTHNNRVARFQGRKLIFANAKQYVTLGASVNALNYFGDIAPKTNITSTDISFTRPGLGVSSSLRLSPSMAVRAEFMYGQLKSSDFEVSDPQDEIGVYRYMRNLHFRNNIKDLSLVGVYDFYKNSGAVIYRVGFTPYVFGGISFFHHNPKALVPQEAFIYPGEVTTLPEAGKWVALRPLHTEGKEHTYSTFQVSIPFGLGARYRVSQLVDVEFELNYRYLFTDYIDDISHNYVDKGLLESELAKVMSDRSLEPTDVSTGKERLLALGERYGRNAVTYTGADGRDYLIMAGYGQANELRGYPKDKDIFLTTSIRVVFMVGKSPFASKRRFRY